MKSPFDVENFYQNASKDEQRLAVEKLIHEMTLGEEAFLFLDGKLTKVKKILLNNEARLKVVD